MADENLILELELRMICNIVINFCIYNNEDPNMVIDFTRLDYLIEKTCLLAIELSLTTAFVPARKIILIFHIYLRYMFGARDEDKKHKEHYSNLRYLKEFIDYRQYEKVPRFKLNSKSPVEQFYKRNNNKNHPIPHIIVVGVLRVLLSSCPNTKKNSTGGVSIHREWASSIRLYIKYKAQFDDIGFKSKVYEHSTLLNDLEQLKTFEEREDKEDDQKAPEMIKDDDYFDLPDYAYENDRHRIITAMIISDLFIFMLKHFKANCINQFIYLSQLLVDANGVLVLLKFLNQSFDKYQGDEFV